MPQTLPPPVANPMAGVLVSADAPAAAPADAGPFGALPGFAMPLIIVGIFYFLLLRPQQKEAKAQEELLRSLKKWDAVVSNTGLHGVVSEVGDLTVAMEIAPGVVVTVDKASIKRKVNSSEPGATGAGKGT